MVLACHASATFLPWWGLRRPDHLAVAGFFGVELFFVLSGWLIGGQLLDILARGAAWSDLRVFLVRRWLRTLPAYYLWLAVLAAFWRPRFWEPDWTAAAGIVPYYALLAQNLAWPQVGGWFAVSWSLAVEEWFYLGFGALLIGIAVLRSPRLSLALALPVFLLVPPLLRAALPLDLDWNEVTRKVVPLRLDAIAVGVAALWLARRSEGPVAAARARPPIGLVPIGLAPIWLAICGLAVIGLQWWGGLQGASALARRLHHVFAFDVAGVGFCLMLPLLARLGAPPAWIAVPVERLAARSYAIYLVHFSVLEWAFRARMVHHAPRLPTALAALAAIPVLASLSWRLLERPILSLRPDYRPALRAPDGRAV